MYSYVEAIENELASINAKTLDIGIEEGISAADTPFIRIVPTMNETGEYNRQNLEFEIYIGTDIKSTLRETYQEHMDFIEQIKTALHLKQIINGICYFKSALYDKDVVKNFKVSKLTFIIEDIV